jgi:hypothetical protein
VFAYGMPAGMAGLCVTMQACVWPFTLMVVR